MRFLTLIAIFVALAVSVSADGTNECNEGFDECGLACRRTGNASHGISDGATTRCVKAVVHWSIHTSWEIHLLQSETTKTHECASIRAIKV
ncbi:hypothetical protein DEU56DRAFT_796877 [Suillus clintonianus]|uniref:uncharacterized protein n=1 Tax=Suillus clintonianus TaxID=1904413 RepID=UPI001B871892|nr:uncharacterized protein DEU56DRAFT_796877 [Suillus clintonianus]KAG2141039.1 hypothetical protein DEU56DRAFT_796877 [Suillus clintonianus]